MPVLVYNLLYGQSYAGLQCEGLFDADVSVKLYGQSYSGAYSEGFWYDAAQQLYGQSYSGLQCEGGVDVNEIGQIYEIQAYGESICGLLADGVMFIDPVEALYRSYWFESQAQVDGSISDCGLRDGAAESEWHA